MTEALQRLRKLSEAATKEPSDEHECAKCHESYSLRENSEPSVFCDACAHGVVAELAKALTLLLDLVEAADKMRDAADYDLKLTAATARYEAAERKLAICARAGCLAAAESVPPQPGDEGGK